MTFAQNPELFTVISIVTIEIALIILCGINKIWNNALLPEIDDDSLKIFFFGNDRNGFCSYGERKEVKNAIS